MPRELQAGSTDPITEHTTILAQGTALPEASAMLQDMCRDGRRIFMELDDDVFHLDPSNPSYHELNQPEIQKNYRDNLAAVRGVIVSTLPLANVVREYTDAPISIIPNYIPAWLLDEPNPVHPGKELKDGDSVAGRAWKRSAVVVGWAGSSHHAMDWEHTAPRLIQWACRNPHAILHTMGELSYIGQYQNQLPRTATAEPWNTDIEQYLRRVGVLDIGVLPLRRHVFNDSKSYIKALELAAHGIPVVASDVTPYSKFVLPGETGFLFQNPGQMATHLDTLMRDTALRLAMGANAKAVARAYTYEANSWKWDQVLQQ